MFALVLASCPTAIALRLVAVGLLSVLVAEVLGFEGFEPEAEVEDRDEEDAVAGGVGLECNGARPLAEGGS